VIAALNLRKAYQGKVVLQASRFVARQGEIAAVVGPSGAGKSTLLRLLAGLEPADQGSIALSGSPVEAARLRRSTCLVLQQPIAFRGSVLYNAALAPRLLGASRRKAQRLGLEALEQVGLAELAKQEAQTLSGGELVRLSLARALTKRPEVLLLDEATANLDPANVAKLEALLSALMPGATIVMVTHNLPQARRLSQTTAVLLDNQLIAQDATPILFNTYPDPRVRAFIRGEMVF